MDLVGYVVTRIARLGKRICLYFEHGPVLVMHLMIAGRLKTVSSAACVTTDRRLPIDATAKFSRAATERPDKHPT